MTITGFCVEFCQLDFGTNNQFPFPYTNFLNPNLIVDKAKISSFEWFTPKCTPFAFEWC